MKQKKNEYDLLSLVTGEFSKSSELLEQLFNQLNNLIKKPVFSFTIEGDVLHLRFKKNFKFDLSQSLASIEITRDDVGDTATFLVTQFVLQGSRAYGAYGPRQWEGVNWR